MSTRSAQFLRACRWFVCTIAMVVGSTAANTQVWYPTQKITIDDGLPQNTVFNHLQDRLGALWIGTPSGLYRYDGTEVTAMDEIESTVLQCAEVDSFIWVLTLSAVHRIDPWNLSIRSAQLPSSDYRRMDIHEQTIRVFKEVPPTQWWFDWDLMPIDEPEEKGAKLHTYPGSLAIDMGTLHFGAKGAYLLTPDSVPLTNAYCSNAVLYDQSILIGTQTGLLEVLPNLDTIVHFSNHKIEWASVDRDSNLWLGTASNGLWMMHRNTMHSRFYPVQLSGDEDQACWEFLISESSVHVMHNEGIAHLAGKRDRKLIQAFQNTACISGLHTETGTLIGTASEGLFLWRNHQKQRIFFNPASSTDNAIVDIAQTPDGFLAISKGSLIALDPQFRINRNISYAELGFPAYAMSIRVTPDGYWLSATTGLHFLNRNFQLIRSMTTSDARVFCQSDETMALSLDGGLYQIDENELSPVYTPLTALLGKLTVGTTTWYMATNGLMREQAGAFEVFQSPEGIPIKEFNQGGIALDSNGLCWFSGLGGACSFHPEALTIASATPTVQFSRADSLLPRSQWELPYHEEELFLKATVINPSGSRYFKTQVIYQNDSLEVTGTSNLNLMVAHGISRIKLIHLSSDGQLIEGRTISVHRPLPPWLRPWFLVMCGIAMLLLIAGVVSTIRNFQHRRRLQSIMQQQRIDNERLRISHELHDNIGARLSHIISSLDIELYGKTEGSERVATINQFARETMSQLRETIWAVGDQCIHFSELAHRIEQYCEQCQRLQPRKVSISYSSKVHHDFELNPVQTINLYRICQEAINNALKYANAHRIEVLVQSVDGKQAEICVNDDGSGFDIEESHVGTGIKGMRRRAEEADAQFQIQSLPGSGTSIRVKMSLR